jgi:AraC-like DNA-binding protein
MPILLFSSLAAFSPNGKPAIIAVRPSNLDTAHRLVQQISLQAQPQSVITGRMRPGECVPIEQDKSTALLPWCSAQAFDQWMRLLSGMAILPVFPEWFFLRAGDEYVYEPLLCLRTVLQSLPSWPAAQLSLANLAAATKHSPRYLLNMFQKHFGVKPGLLLRALNLFAITARLMQNEAQLPPGRRRGLSPLNQTTGDYPRRLQRLLGITYTDLLEASRAEHWAVVWMRQWRKKIFAKYPAP